MDVAPAHSDAEPLMTGTGNGSIVKVMDDEIVVGVHVPEAVSVNVMTPVSKGLEI
jgi:hypothetical protein